MIDRCLCKKVSREAAFLVLMLICVFKMSGSFHSPDFAYPKVISTDAQVMLDKAIDVGNGSDALKAAIQIAISESMVSMDNYERGLEAFSKIEDRFDFPWKNLAYLLEAKLYSDIYKHQRLIIEQRKISDDSSSNVFEWDSNDFKIKIDSLIECALKMTTKEESFSLQVVSSVLKNYQDAAKYNVTVRDFLEIQCFELSREFDLKRNFSYFKVNNSVTSGNNNVGRDAYWAWYEYSNRLNHSQNFLEECISKFIATPYCAQFLCAKSYRNEETRYKELRRYLDKFPDCVNHEEIENELGRLKVKNISFITECQYLPYTKIDFKLECANIDEFHTLIVKIPSTYLNKPIRLDNISANGVVVKSIPVSVKSQPGKIENVSITTDGLAPGVYALCASKNTGLSGMMSGISGRRTVSSFLVSNLSYIISKGDKDNNTGKLYIVNGKSQTPLSGVKVGLTSNDSRMNRTLNFITGSDGSINIPKGGWNFSVADKGNLLNGYIWGENFQRVEGTILRAHVLTNLSLYRPGEKVCVTSIVYQNIKRELSACSNFPVNIKFLNPEGELVDSLTVVTDEFGRSVSSFELPMDCTPGNYNIVIDKDGSYIASTLINVADYKSPKFYILAKLEGTEANGRICGTDSVLTVRGEVRTYSGMPVTDAKLNYDIKAFNFYLSSKINNVINGEILADSNGEFRFNIPLDSLVNSLNSKSFILDILATSNGEFATSPSLRFYSGNQRRIQIDELPDKINIDASPQTYKVRVVDPVGLNVNDTVFYKVLRIEGSESKQFVESGKFVSPEFDFNLKRFNSGKYQITFSLSEFLDYSSYTPEKEVGAEWITTIYRSSDTIPPFETALWLPYSEIKVERNSKSVKIPFGNSYKGDDIFLQVSNCDSICFRKWVKSDGKNSFVFVPAPSSSERVNILISAMHDLTPVVGKIKVVPDEQYENVKIKTISFRDKIVPGNMEHWKFQFMFNDQPLDSVAAICTMTDKSLNSITPFKWVFNPYGGVYYPDLNNVSVKRTFGVSWNLSLTNYKSKKTCPFIYPYINQYGYSLFPTSPRFYKSFVKGRGSIATGSSSGYFMEMSQVKLAKSDAVEECAVETDCNDIDGREVDMGGVVDEKNNSNLGQYQLRMGQNPSAFYLPNLVTNSEGEVCVDFRVPDFNGTWQFQLAGYCKSMKSAQILYDVVASKALMVSINSPKFLYAGDEVVFSARVYNNTELKTTADIIFEVFDIDSGDNIVSKKKSDVDIDSHKNNIVEIEYKVGPEVKNIGLRVIANSGFNSDGEQIIIPILPAITPTIEAAPFFISGNDMELNIGIPKSFTQVKGYDSNLSLSIASNPLWECLSALSKIQSSQYFNSISVAKNLYSFSIRNLLMEKYPVIRDIIINTSEDKSFSKDSLLTCNIKYLNELQNKDGGWSWCSGMKSSEFTTMQILDMLGKLKSLQILPNMLESSCKEAVEFIDRKVSERVLKYQGHAFPFIELLNYLWIRENYKNIPCDPIVKKFTPSIIESVKKKWKNLDIVDKSKAAIILYNYGYKMVAREILESIKQFSSQSDEKGMWFNNLRNPGNEALHAVSMALTAYDSVSPHAPEIGKLRQWMLLDKLSRNWGDSPFSTEAIYAVVRSYDGFVDIDNEIGVWVDGTEYKPYLRNKFTGSLKFDLPTHCRSISIRKNGSLPVWGGIVNTVTAPTSEIKPFKSGNISVEKKITVLQSGTASTISNLKFTGNDRKGSTQLSPGDIIRVNIILKLDRAIDMIEIRDDMAPFMSPVNQLSGYEINDGVWMYKEVKIDKTNFFIENIEKGIHVFSYDCVVSHSGEFNLGIVTAQSQYAPAIAAHSGGKMILINGCN